MKKIIHVNRIILGAVFLLVLNSCKNEPKHEDPVQTPDKENETKFETKDIADDSAFLTEAASINLMEVEVGKLALQKSLRKDIKDYAQMLIDDHTRSLDELQMLASQNTITLPAAISDVDREKYNELNKSGNEFDKKFIDMMVEGHEKAVDKMTQISQKATNEDFKLWASRQTSAFLNHFEEAKKLKEKI
ncbi:DUF4142 domain-containing protein [Flavobacterium aestuarii]|uniref:DUF4142 domain-containing protein n=1 Tax=Flavobacterium aestuarii TaxID=3149227 RepID=UPI0032B3D3CF